MSYSNDLSVADIAAVTGNRNGGGWGGDWSSWIILFLIFGMFGWGGFGGFGGFGGGMNGGVGSEVQRGFDHSAVVTKLDGVTTGLADLGYANINALNNGFHGVDRGLCDLGSRIDNCCCTTQRSIDAVNYNLATQSCDTRNLIQSTTRDIIDNANGNTRAILDFLTQDKIDSLRSENQNLKLAASQSAQNAYLTATIDAGNAELLRRINPTPVPAYRVPAPYPYGYGYGCGCGC